MDRKAFLRQRYARLVDRLGFKFSPDEELVEDLLDAQVELERRFGAPYCPCQGRTGVRSEDMRIVCPCIPYHRAHYDAIKRCWCGLFVHKDVSDPDALPQTPLSELDLDPQPAP